MGDTGVFVAAVLAWAGFGYKLRHLRQRPSDQGTPALRALVVLLGLLAGVFTLLPRAVGAPIDALAGVPGTGRLLANILAMVTCLAVLGWLLHLSRPAPAARAQLAMHARVLVVFIASVLALFAADHPPVTPDREFAGAHMYLVLAYLGYAEVGLVQLSWRYGARLEAPLLSLGLRIVAVANVVGLLFVLTELVYLVEWDLGLDFYGSPTVSRPLYVAAAILFVIGLTLPAWGPWLGLEKAWWRATRYHATRRLRPLWSDVTRACPGVVLDRDLLAASPFGERLAAERLPVEIYDGWLQLRYYLEQGDIVLIDEMAARRSRTRGPAVAAAWLAAALHRRAVAAGPPARTVPVVEYLGSGTSRTLVADVRFLCAVSKDLRSRFVRDVLAQLDTVEGPPSAARPPQAIATQVRHD